MKFQFSAMALVLAFCGSAQAALTAGDIAIIGRTNDASPDAFSFVTLANIAAGETVYFTDNGWTGSAYRGSSATDGDGNEGLAKWVATSAVSAGTILGSSALTTSGTITGVSSSYSALAFGQGGDQINVFQNSNVTNPLFNTATQTALYAFDDTNAFEAAVDSNSGAVPNGVSVVANTAVTLNASVGGTVRVKASVLSTLGNNKAAWLAAIANKANWEAGATGSVLLPTGSINVATAAVPEPEGYAMVLAGLGILGLLARRRQA
jgi:hypothetical protein